jgi:hypothetical protein
LQDGRWAEFAAQLLEMFKKSLKIVGFQMGMPSPELATTMLGLVRNQVWHWDIFV